MILTRGGAGPWTYSSDDDYLVLEGYYRDLNNGHEWRSWGHSKKGGSSHVDPILEKNIKWAKDLAYSAREWEGPKFKVRIVRVVNEVRETVFEYQFVDTFSLTFGKGKGRDKVVLDIRTGYEFKEYAENDAEPLKEMGYWVKIAKEKRNEA